MKNKKGISSTNTRQAITESDLPPAMWKAIDEKAAERGIDTERMVNEICREWLADDKEVEFFKKSRSKKEYESHTMELKLRPDVWGLLVCHSMNYDTDVETYLNDYLNRSDLD